MDGRLVDSSVSDLIADEVQPCSRTQPRALRQLSVVASWRVAPTSAVIAAGSPVITVLLLSLHHYTI